MRVARTFLAVMGMGMVLGAAPGNPSASAAVLVEGYAFAPATVRIPVGGSVTWTLGADPEQHTVTPVAPAPFEDSGNLFSGDTFEVTFEEPGTWEYLCTLHPTMRGSVVVLAAATSTPPPSISASPSSVVPPSVTTATASAAAADLPEPGAPQPGSSTSVLVIGVLVGIAALGVVLVATTRLRARD